MGNQNAKVSSSSVRNSKAGLEFDEGEPKSRTNWTAGAFCFILNSVSHVQPTELHEVTGVDNRMSFRFLNAFSVSSTKI